VPSWSEERMVARRPIYLSPPGRVGYFQAMPRSGDPLQLGHGSGWCLRNPLLREAGSSVYECPNLKPLQRLP
jgi:hypothetical protein